MHTPKHGYTLHLKKPLEQGDARIADMRIDALQLKEPAEIAEACYKILHGVTGNYYLFDIALSVYIHRDDQGRTMRVRLTHALPRSLVPSIGIQLSIRTLCENPATVSWRNNHARMLSEYLHAHAFGEVAAFFKKGEQPAPLVSRGRIAVTRDFNPQEFFYIRALWKMDDGVIIKTWNSAQGIHFAKVHYIPHQNHPLKHCIWRIKVNQLILEENGVGGKELRMYLREKLNLHNTPSENP